MSTINLMKPGNMPDQLIGDEFISIKRIIDYLLSGNAKTCAIQKLYSVDKYNNKFFYNKIKWLHKRYLLIRLELARRHTIIVDFNDLFIDCKLKYPSLYNSWEPKDCDFLISKSVLYGKICKNPEYYTWNYPEGYRFC